MSVRSRLWRSTAGDEGRKPIHRIAFRMLNGGLRLLTMLALFAIVLARLALFTRLALLARLIRLSFARLKLRLGLRLLNRHKPWFGTEV
jgi:hypothetical protein